MTLVASVCAAVLAYLVIGTLVGVRPQWQPRRRHGASGRARLAAWLGQSGTAIEPEGFTGVVVGSAAACSLLVAAVSGIPALNAIAGLAGGAIPVVLVEQRRKVTAHGRRAAWPDALRDLSTRLRSGASLHTALVDLGRLGPTPLRAAFVRYETLAAALDHRVALETVRSDLADPLSDRVIEILVIAFEQGTRVVIDILDDLAESAVADLSLMADIETAQLETKLEARGAAVLPFVVLVLLCIGSDGYRGFYSSRAGTTVILFGFVMSVVGVMMIGRLGRIESEPRTLRRGGVST